MIARRTRDQHLAADGRPKRILSLDGGGIRGVFTLQYLERIERLLREKYDDPDLLLCDYFDLIGGTSTGSIIAAGLASGRDVAFLQDQYRTLGDRIFADDGGLRLPGREALTWRPGEGRLRARLRDLLTRRILPASIRGLLAPKFPSGPLEEALATHFDFPLGSDALRTGLVVVSRRADTGSVWPMHNNPRGKYFDHDEPGQNWIPNKDYPVDKLIAASAAAPTYFRPQRLTIGTRPDGSPEEGLFVDGGVSPFNNPSLLLLMMATQSGYRFDWDLGENKLLLVSIGTAYRPKTMDEEQSVALHQAILNLTALMDDCDQLTRWVLQWMASTRTPAPIDSEVGDLVEDSPGGTKLLSYLRYNVQLPERWLTTLPPWDTKPDAFWQGLAAMDRPENLDELIDLGRAAAERQVLAEHFDPAFDPPGA